MREIGSEFWSAPTTDKKSRFLPEHTQWYLSGRSALQAIIQELKHYHTVAMPSWCCDSMIKPFVDAGMKIVFYPVYWDDGLKQDIRLDCDILFLMDYFGYGGSQPDLTRYHGVIIRDVTHTALSSIRTDADYYFGSLRKWCGVWTGGFAWAENGCALSAGKTADKEYIILREKAMRLKEAYISAASCIDGHFTADKNFLDIFHKAEEHLDDIGIASAAERDVKVAEKLDIKYIQQCRRNNAALLMEAFPQLLVFRKTEQADCPLFVPILVPNGSRDKLRKYLIQKEIYCPIHWPISIYHRLNAQTEKIYAEELSLICDQRYSEDDMIRMIDAIKVFWKGV